MSNKTSDDHPQGEPERHRTPLSPEEIEADQRALLEAEKAGVDLGALRAMLMRTPAERLRMLDEEIAFFRAADRAREGATER